MLQFAHILVAFLVHFIPEELLRFQIILEQWPLKHILICYLHDCIGRPCPESLRALFELLLNKHLQLLAGCLIHVVEEACLLLGGLKVNGLHGFLVSLCCWVIPSKWFGWNLLEGSWLWLLCHVNLRKHVVVACFILSLFEYLSHRRFLNSCLGFTLWNHRHF